MAAQVEVKSRRTDAQDDDVSARRNLENISADLLAIGHELALLLPDEGTSRLRSDADFAAAARKLYFDRRRRASVFDANTLFGEPAWDMLLDLFVAELEQTPVSVTSACIGSVAPATTGLRWLGMLEELQLVERRPDPRDQRRFLVSLTQNGSSRMREYLRQCESTSTARM